MSKSVFDLSRYLSKLPEHESTLKLCQCVGHALDEMKALNIVFIDVKGISNVTDIMVIASGSSNRHVKAVADFVMEHGKQNHFDIFGSEGQDSSEWILIDFGDVVVHVMQEHTRNHYELEKLWTHRPDDFRSEQ